MKTISRKKFITVISIIAVVCLLFVSAAGIFVFKFYSRYSKLIEIDKIVRNNYFWEIDENVLTDAICEGYIDGIGDKYAYYKNNEETENKKLDTQGKTIGIGVYVIQNPDNGNIVVTNVMNNSPASKAGLRQFDEIVAIGDITVDELSYKEAIDLLKCEQDDIINITVLRDKQHIDIRLLCEEFTTQNVYYRTIDNIGYIKIISFDRVTYKQFEIAVEALVKQGVKGLIFDVQGNSGGTFDAMSEMLDMLVGEDDLLTIEYADGTKKKACHSDENEIDLPMAVLMDSSSASASELFAATLRDYGKAVLIGEKTYGKCVMQRSYTLSDGTSIRITIAKCLTKSGYDFNGKGIEPDIAIELNSEQEKYYYKLDDDENPLIIAAADWINKQ